MKLRLSKRQLKAEKQSDGPRRFRSSLTWLGAVLVVLRMTHINLSLMMGQYEKLAEARIEELRTQDWGDTNNKGKVPDDAPRVVTTLSTTSNVLSPDRKVYFMGIDQLDIKDAFSASWLQTKQDFLSMEFDRLMICEDAAVLAYGGFPNNPRLSQSTKDRAKKLRMPLDWLDFSVEHLSKWWKLLLIFRQKEVYDIALQRFDTYLAKAPTFPMEMERSFQATIAVIAFQPYKDGREQEQAYNLTLKSLAATIESLRRGGFGRVVVVGEPNDNQVVKDTFSHLKQVVENNNAILHINDATFITQVGSMEVGFAPFNPLHAKTNHLPKNMPRAALMGLKGAFDLASKPEHTDQEVDYMLTWLGEDNPDWQYVYLTEPDSILQTRPSTLKQLKEQVDQGMVLSPHRLQPIPHEVDARGSQKTHLFLPEKDFPVLDLDSGNDACCDAHLGPTHKPGKEPNFEGCDHYWWFCGFDDRKSEAERSHKRLKEYSLIRLKQGTGIVSLAALAHGRPCLPKRNGVCLPPSLEQE